MRICYWGKDGGAESTVSGFWLIEIKSLFSIALLRFGNGSRDAFHSHAFNSFSWLLKGMLVEVPLSDHVQTMIYTPNIKPIYTPRERFHRVFSNGVSWVLTLRGPWQKTWKEWRTAEGRMVTLTHGRKECND